MAVDDDASTIPDSDQELEERGMSEGGIFLRLANLCRSISQHQAGSQQGGQSKQTVEQIHAENILLTITRTIVNAADEAEAGETSHADSEEDDEDDSHQRRKSAAKSFRTPSPDHSLLRRQKEANTRAMLSDRCPQAAVRNFLDSKMLTHATVGRSPVWLPELTNCPAAWISSVHRYCRGC